MNFNSNQHDPLPLFAGPGSQMARQCCAYLDAVRLEDQQAGQSGLEFFLWVLESVPFLIKGIFDGRYFDAPRIVCEFS